MATQKVKLICENGESMMVDLDVAERSLLIKGMIDDSGADEEIPLPNVKKGILEKVVAFCLHMRENAAPEIEKPLKSANMAELTTPWYAEYIKLEQEVLFDLILAANYLDVKPLLDLACAKTASLIKNKSI